MTQKNILICGELFLKEERVKLAENHKTYCLWDFKSLEDFLDKHGEEIDAVVAMHYIPLSASHMDMMPNLKLVSTFSVGTDHIDLTAARDKGITVTNTPDVLCRETADTGLSLLLATARRIAEADKFVRQGKWGEGQAFPLGTTLGDKHVGIVGLGGIGRLVAKRCEAFEMNISYFGPHRKDDVSYTYYDDLEEMAKKCDFLILCCPGNEKTKNLVNSDILAALGEAGMLVNIARGSVVDEEALIDALENKKIRAAGLDVFDNEPQIDPRFFSLDNVVLSPHIGSATTETRHAMGQLVLDNVTAFFEGRPVLTPV